MITEEQQGRIQDLICDAEDLNSRLAAVAALEPEELAYLVSAYNWDDGFEIPMAIAKHPKCCRAVALELFHAGAGDSWLERTEPISEYQKDWDSFCRYVFDGFNTDRYRLGALSYTPPYDRIDLYKIKKAGVLPEWVYLPILGSPAANEGH